MARPRALTTKFDSDVVNVILRALALGESIAGAAAAGGISSDTYRKWCKMHPSFAMATQKACSNMRQVNLARIEQAANRGTWQAAAWILERRYPAEFGRNKVDMSEANIGPIHLVDAGKEAAGRIRGSVDASRKLNDALAAAAVQTAESLLQGAPVSARPTAGGRGGKAVRADLTGRPAVDGDPKA